MSRKRAKPRGRKPRNEHICATTVGNVTELVVTVDERTGEISFGQEMTNVYSERSYDRAKGPKVISRVPQANGRLSFDDGPALEKNYDVVCAVDTNTKAVQGKRVSMVGVATAKRGALAERDGIKRFWRYDVPFCLEYIALQGAPENFGWMAALEIMGKRGLIQRAQRVGLIVDSDLGNIRAYNERSKPVDNHQLLPAGVTLIYATADAGKESVANQVLGIADTAATQCLLGLEQGIIPMNAERADNPLFEAFRCIGVNTVEGLPGGGRVAMSSPSAGS
jgi:hypothetical protein